MAERKRRDDDPGDERLEEEFPTDMADEDDDAFGDDDVDEPAARSTRSRGGTATKARRSTAEGAKPVKKDSERFGIFGRFVRFIREVVAELRKVIWPTRKELLTYTAVVVVFVTVMLAIVGGLDVAFAKAVLWVFGSNRD